MIRNSIIAASLMSGVAFAKSNDTGSTPPAPPADGETVAATPVAGAVSEIESGIPVPVKIAGAGGGPSPYPFDKLEVGQSFHVAGKSKKQLNSTMHTANKKYRVDEKDANGNVVTEVKVGKNKDGQETRKTVNKYIETRKFEHFDVDATDPRGAGVRVFRTA